MRVHLKPPYQIDRDVVAKFNINPIILGILYNRNIRSIKDVQNFISPTLSTLTDPFLMSGMESASGLLAEAISKGQRICIFGDYDADGVTSSALVSRFFQLLSFSNFIVYIPNRFKEGYGMNIPAIDHLIDEENVDVFLTVDLGISNIKEIDHVKARGKKIVITDHHLPGEKLPSADAIVNPQLADCRAGKEYLAGCGVSFNLIIAIRSKLAEMGLIEKRDINIKNLLDILALGTVADVVSLVKENRVFVTEGLKILNDENAGNPGLKEISRIVLEGKEVISSHLGFTHGPRINASGRIRDSLQSYRLLMADDEADIQAIAEDLEQCNADRREIGDKITEECIRMVESNGLSSQGSIVLFGTDFNHGVIGISAGRLKDRYYKPVFVLARDEDSEGFIKGSGRSPSHFHLKDVLDCIHKENPDLIVGYGGHAAAAGITLKSENFKEFERVFEQFAKSNIAEEDEVPYIDVECILKPEQLTVDLADSLEMLSPFGQGNAKPIFGADLAILGSNELSEGKHLKISFSNGTGQIDGIIWGVDEGVARQYREKEGSVVRCYFNIEINEFRGNRKAQLVIKHTELVD